mmetsp:Transcript_28565/g.70402  ORF Transcript_28565/g.70402 Transcript_28565/m.70402 type:complete len:347 (+) Transcript_28565:561-1601(+)
MSGSLGGFRLGLLAELGGGDADDHLQELEAQQRVTLHELRLVRRPVLHEVRRDKQRVAVTPFDGLGVRLGDAAVLQELGVLVELHAPQGAAAQAGVVREGGGDDAVARHQERLQVLEHLLGRVQVGDASAVRRLLVLALDVRKEAVLPRHPHPVLLEHARDDLVVVQEVPRVALLLAGREHAGLQLPRRPQVDRLPHHLVHHLDHVLRHHRHAGRVHQDVAEHLLGQQRGVQHGQRMVAGSGRQRRHRLEHDDVLGHAGDADALQRGAVGEAHLQQPRDGDGAPRGLHGGRRRLLHRLGALVEQVPQLAVGQGEVRVQGGAEPAPVHVLEDGGARGGVHSRGAVEA